MAVTRPAVTRPATGDGGDGGDGGDTTSAGDEAGDEPGDDDDDGMAEGRDRTGTAADGPGNPDEIDVAPAVWEECDDGLQCATVAVPLDHRRPGGPTIDLALVRIAASGSPRGSILVNFGGPGAPAAGRFRSGFSLDGETMAHYHLVGFDPRGVGQSAPLSCGVDLTRGPRPDLSPDDPTEAEQLDAAARDTARRCDRLDGDLLPHLGTASVVADVELLRRALGDDRLHYLGFSYGTLLGLRYAQRFPDRVGRMVLDGVVDPAFGLTDLLRQQAREFERAFEVMDGACGRGLSCPDGGLAGSFDRLRDDLDRPDATPAPVGGVGPAELEVAALLSLYAESLWPRFADAVSAAETGDTSGIERLHDLYVGGIDFAAYLAVVCIDGPTPDGAAAWDRLAAELATISPRFGAALANEVRACAHWPVEGGPTPPALEIDDTAPILVLSTTGDAATPLANAARVAAALPAAGLVIADDEGHTAYGRSFCVDRIVADYFTTGRLPGEVHRC